MQLKALELYLSFFATDRSVKRRRGKEIKGLMSPVLTNMNYRPFYHEEAFCYIVSFFFHFVNLFEITVLLYFVIDPRWNVY